VQEASWAETCAQCVAVLLLVICSCQYPHQLQHCCRHGCRFVCLLKVMLVIGEPFLQCYCCCCCFRCLPHWLVCQMCLQVPPAPAAAGAAVALAVPASSRRHTNPRTSSRLACIAHTQHGCISYGMHACMHACMHAHTTKGHAVHQAS
jgi:hypothetical protein